MESCRLTRIASLVIAMAWSVGCGGDDGTTSTSGFHPSGGVYEATQSANPNARLHYLRHTAVIRLEATGSHPGDSGREEGVDELRYRFDQATEITLSLGDDGLVLVVLGGSGAEIARLTPATGPLTIGLNGEYTFRFEHPRRGDPDAEPILVFVHPLLPAAALSAGEGGGAGIAVAGLEVSSGTCVGCDLSGLVMDGCESSIVIEAKPDGFQGASFDGSDLRCIDFLGSPRFDMLGTSFDDASLFRVTFDHSDHDGGSFRNTLIQDPVFRYARAPDADFSDARFVGDELDTSCVNFRELNGALFANTLFDENISVWGTIFFGSDLSSARFLGTKLQEPVESCGFLPFFPGGSCFFQDGKVCSAAFACPTPGTGCEEVPVLGDDISGVVFDGVDLRGISFRRAALNRAVFSSCILDDDTDFDAASLFQVKFAGTSLVDVDLSKANGVSQVDFTGSILSNGSRGANLSCDPAGTGLCGFKSFPGFDLRYVQLNGADLLGADLRDTRLDFAQFRDTVLAAAQLDGATVCGTDFSDGHLSGASLRGWIVYGPHPVAGDTCQDETILAGADLAGADFTGVDLARADLSAAFLSESVTAATWSNGSRGANLSCDRSCDECRHPGLCGLAGTIALKGRDLRHVQLNNVDLSQADLEGARFDHGALIGANLDFANLMQASFVGTLMGVDLDSGVAATKLRGAYMLQANLTDADLRGADLSAAHVYGDPAAALFVRAKLSYANLTGAILSGAIFTDAQLNQAVLDGAQLTQAVFDGANLANAKFDNAYLQGADFSTATSIAGMSLSNAAVSTNLVSSKCTLVAPGSWTYDEQDGTPYTFTFGETQLQTDSSVICPDGGDGPCLTADSLCPVRLGPNPPVAQCVPLASFCWENCLDPPVFDDTSCFSP